MKNYFSIFLSIIFVSLTNVANADVLGIPFLSCFIERNQNHDITLYNYQKGRVTPKVYVNGTARNLQEGETSIVSDLLPKGSELIAHKGKTMYQNNSFSIIVKSQRSASLIFGNERFECLPHNN